MDFANNKVHITVKLTTLYIRIRRANCIIYLIYYRLDFLIPLDQLLSKIESLMTIMLIAHRCIARSVEC